MLTTRYGYPTKLRVSPYLRTRQTAELLFPGVHQDIDRMIGERVDKKNIQNVPKEKLFT